MLNFGLETDVLLLSDVVCYFQVSILVLDVFPLHFREELVVIALIRLLLTKDHFSSKLLAFHGFNTLSPHVPSWAELRVAHKNSALVNLSSWH